MPLFLLFVAVPIIEIALFIQVGGWIGLWPTLAIVVLTALAGTILVRTQGIQTLHRLQTNLAEGRDPVGPIAHGALILAAGLLLLTPGFFTDAVALALLVPPVRAALIRWGASRLVVVAAGGVRTRPPHPPRAGPQTVEAEYEILDERPAETEETRSRTRRAGGSRWTEPPR
jgi:UPF0716 protein FxsA